MLNLESILPFIDVLIAGLACVILLFGSKKRPYTRYLLFGAILTFAYLNLIVALVVNGDIINFPNLYRTASPGVYLTAPLIYLYTRAILKNENGLKWKDSIHFIPTILHTVELMPFFLKSTAYKQELLFNVINNPDLAIPINEGILPPYVQFFIRTGLGIIYFTTGLILVWKFWKHKKPIVKDQKLQLSWLSWLNIMMLFIYVLCFVLLVLENELGTIIYFASTMLSITFLGILLILFFRPKILYGFSDSTNKKDLSPPNQSRQIQLSTNDISNYLKVVNDYMEAKSPFLNPEFRLLNLSKDTNISRHHLSAAINESQGENFNHFVNTYRVNYVIKNFNNPDWNHLSLDGMGQQAGFRSRSTFLKSFKKITGKTPSEYKKEL
jgi:AraC-like DNA-binding protein